MVISNWSLTQMTFKNAMNIVFPIRNILFLICIMRTWNRNSVNSKSIDYQRLLVYKIFIRIFSYQNKNVKYSYLEIKSFYENIVYQLLILIIFSFNKRRWHESRRSIFSTTQLKILENKLFIKNFHVKIKWLHIFFYIFVLLISRWK